MGSNADIWVTTKSSNRQSYTPKGCLFRRSCVPCCLNLCSSEQQAGHLVCSICSSVSHPLAPQRSSPVTCSSSSWGSAPSATGRAASRAGEARASQTRGRGPGRCCARGPDGAQGEQPGEAGANDKIAGPVNDRKQQECGCRGIKRKSKLEGAICFCSNPVEKNSARHPVRSSLSTYQLMWHVRSPALLSSAYLSPYICICTSTNPMKIQHATSLHW